MNLRVTSRTRTIVVTGQQPARDSRKITLHPHRSKASGWATLLGVLAALLILEVLLRPWATVLTRYGARPVSEDGPASPIITVRNFEEGIAVAHFTPSRARLTGNPIATGFPWLLVLGDSFVAAVQIDDKQTIGSQIESLSTTDGHRVNVRQYGWIAAGPSKYILESDELLRRWQPALVAVVLNADDFAPEALHDRWANMLILPDGSAAVERVDPEAENPSHAMVARIASRSGLLQTVLMRFVTDIRGGLPAIPRLPSISNPWAAKERSGTAQHTTEAMVPTSREIVRASLAAMQKAYGNRLFIVYASEPGLDDQPDSKEVEALRECGLQGIACVATRDLVVGARNRGESFAAGFANTEPAAGHYNADGARLIADEIWLEYKRRDLTTRAGTGPIH